MDRPGLAGFQVISLIFPLPKSRTRSSALVRGLGSQSLWFWFGTRSRAVNENGASGGYSLDG